MAGDWIKVRVWISKDPKVIAIADYLAYHRDFLRWLCAAGGLTVRECAYEVISRDITVMITGAELPAMIMIDTLLRELPGVVGKEASVKNDSFQGDLFDYPSYTRPEEFRGWKVPDVLLSGHHAQIEAWRQQKAHEKTHKRSQR
jgi:tRNA (guanine-N1)-methyltransferase